MDRLVSETLGLSGEEYEGHLADLIQDEGRAAVKQLILLIEKELELLKLEESDYLAAPTHYLPFLPEQGGFRDRVIEVCLQDKTAEDRREALYRIRKNLREVLMENSSQAKIALKVTETYFEQRAMAVLRLTEAGFLKDCHSSRRKHYPKGMHRPEANPFGNRSPLRAALDALKQAPEHRARLLRRLLELDAKGVKDRGDVLIRSEFGHLDTNDMGTTLNEGRGGNLFKDLVGMHDHSRISTIDEPQRVREVLDPRFSRNNACIARTLTPEEIIPRGRDTVSILDIHRQLSTLPLGQYYSVRHVNPLGWVALGDPADPRKSSTQVSFNQFLLGFGQVHAGTAYALTNMP